MQIMRVVADSERWTWFATGDETIAPPARSTSQNNTPQRLLFEIGLVVAVPLALAALFTVLLGG